MQFDQREFRDRLYTELPPEWLPDLEEAPVAAAVLDMLASLWTSQAVLERTLQLAVNSNVMLLDGEHPLPIDTAVAGPGVIGNPLVQRAFVATVDGLTYQAVQVSAAQTLDAGTKLLFRPPDAENDGLIQFLHYIEEQSRLNTSTGIWLDLFGADFFGASLQRHIHETDDSYRHRLLVNLISPRVTRCAVFCGLENLTGHEPKIIEVRNTGDCGAYTSLIDPVWCGAAYNTIGAYGSMKLPFQFFVRAIRPLGEGIPNVSGYCASTFGYATVPQPWGYIGPTFPPNTGTGEWVTLADLENNMAVTDADIYQQVADCCAAGVTAWTSISTDIQSEIHSTGLLSISFYLNLTTLAGSISTDAGHLRIPGSSMGKISAVVTMLASGFSATGILRIGAAAVVSNPNFAVVASIVVFAKAVISMNTHLAEVAAVLTFEANAVMANGLRFTATARLTFSSAINLTTSNAIVAIGRMTISASVVTIVTSGISIGRINAAILAVNGLLIPQFVSVNFTVGSSSLTPAGGHLGQTVLLGTSKIGVDYGF